MVVELENRSLQHEFPLQTRSFSHEDCLGKARFTFPNCDARTTNLAIRFDLIRLVKSSLGCPGLGWRWRTRFTRAAEAATLAAAAAPDLVLQFTKEVRGLDAAVQPAEPQLKKQEIDRNR